MIEEAAQGIFSLAVMTISLHVLFNSIDETDITYFSHLSVSTVIYLIKLHDLLVKIFWDTVS